MRRLAGKFALFLAGVYGLVVVGAITQLVRGVGHSVWFWSFLVVPAAAFGPAVLAAVRLHRTEEPSVVARLWRESLLYGVAGTALLVAAAVAVHRMER